LQAGLKDSIIWSGVSWRSKLGNSGLSCHLTSMNIHSKCRNVRFCPPQHVEHTSFITIITGSELTLGSFLLGNFHAEEFIASQGKSSNMLVLEVISIQLVVNLSILDVTSEVKYN